jgi:hypothetical protein
MTNPDYKNYSLPELNEALNTIDENMYPDRVELIRYEIQKRIKEQDNIQYEESKKTNLKFEDLVEFKRFIFFFEQSVIFLKIASIFMAISIINIFFPCLKIPGSGYNLTILFPGLSSLSDNFKEIILITIVVILNGSLLIGSIGSFFSKKFMLLLVLPWGLLSIGLNLPLIKWWPTLQLGFPISIGLTLFGLPLCFKINLFPTFFFLWGIFAVPELRRQFLRSN